MNVASGTEPVSLSRASSRASRKSSHSRSQSLAKKNSAPSDLRPSDVLIERFVAWKAIVKQLIAYFEGIADIHNSNAKELTKLGAVIQVPFKAGNQFLGEGGLQDIYYDIRDRTRTIADQHANLGRTIDSSIVQHLEKLRAEIKAHLKNIQYDTGKLASNVAKERELSARLISELSTGISSFKSTPMDVTNRTDPYVINQAVARQLAKQVHEENRLHQSIIAMQQNSAHFEEGIVRAIQSAWQTYDEWQARMGTAIADTHVQLATHMRSLAPDREWLAFSGRGDHLLDPDMPLRDPHAISYPSKDDPSVAAIHAGLLERKKRYTRAYKEHYFVLTPAGFLHEYASSDPAVGKEPLFSLFLPMCTLGPPSSEGAKSHKFHIEGRKDGSGTTKGGSFRRSLSLRRGGGEHAWSFKARSREEMMEWWNDMRALCARYLVASEQTDRGGPVLAAVRAAGYRSEDSVSDGGSSIDEEGEGLEYVDAPEGEPPSYSMQYGSGDYPAEKSANGHQRSASRASHRSGANVSRGPSKRQQEKAPEGKEPHVRIDDEQRMMPGGESRFKEEF